MENVKLIDASAEGTVTFEFYIDERYSNVNGVMRELPVVSSLSGILLFRPPFPDLVVKEPQSESDVSLPRQVS